MNEENKGIFSCNGMSWIAGALLGLATYLILRGRWDVAFILALIVGLAVLVGVGFLLSKIFCGEVEETAGGYAAMAAQRSEERKQYEADRADAKADQASADAAADDAAAALEKAREAEAAKEAAEAEVAAKIAAQEASAAEAEARALAAEAAAGDAKAEAEAKLKAAEAAEKAAQEAKAAEAAAASSKSADAAKPATDSAKSSTGTAKPARKPVAPDGKPEMLTEAREGGADDLKMIKGVGPKLEALLNSLGVYHFDQIAGWRKKEVEWVDQNLEGFKGRVSRDEWVKQAKVLAKGGTTDFAKKVKKGGVY